MTYYWKSKHRYCRRCMGDGVRPCDWCWGIGALPDDDDPCPECLGSGKGVDCPECAGAGFLEVEDA